MIERLAIAKWLSFNRSIFTGDRSQYHLVQATLRHESVGTTSRYLHADLTPIPRSKVTHSEFSTFEDFGLAIAKPALFFV
ncbi:MAG: hypothetical protein AB1861_01305 [Cyanobacteriota bacterium]